MDKTTIRMFREILREEEAEHISNPYIERMKRDIRKAENTVEHHKIGMKGSIRGNWHTVWSGEDTDPTRTEYTIIPDHGQTDDEMDALMDEMRIDICSPYDCTGKVFTSGLWYTRIPAGIAIVHRTSLDI